MVDQTKNIMIGLFVIAACTVVIFILMFLHPSVGDEALKLRVRFSDIDKINIGSRVGYAGKAVGEVSAIHELEEASQQRVARNGQIYLYELELQVDSNVNVFNSDEVTLRTSGLLGERSVAIIPHAPEPGEELRLVNKEIIYASEVAGVKETFKQLQEVAANVEKAITSMTEVIDEIRDEKLVKKFGDAAESLGSLAKGLDRPEDWEAIVKNIRTTTDNLAAGKGTLGRLVTDDDLYLHVKSIMNKGETTMNDINHYGLLFHLDKGWQRLRARRMNLLQKLCTPQEFRNFFNDEIDKISTSLERVNMIIEKTDCCPMYEELMDNEDFRKVYAELLRRVEAMEEELKMYNEQLVNTDVQKTELSSCPYCPPYTMENY